jgi:hypothetical protein
MAAVKPVAQAVAFLLELVLVAAFADWGFSVDASAAVQVVLGIGLPVLLIVIWGIWLAPRAERRLIPSTRIAAKATLFLLGSIAMFAAGHHALAVVFELVSVASVALEPRLEPAG